MTGPSWRWYHVGTEAHYYHCESEPFSMAVAGPITMRTRCTASKQSIQRRGILWSARAFIRAGTMPCSDPEPRGSPPLLLRRRQGSDGHAGRTRGRRRAMRGRARGRWMYSRLQEQSGASCRAGAPAELAAVPCRCDCERATWHGRACHV